MPDNRLVIKKIERVGTIRVLQLGENKLVPLSECLTHQASGRCEKATGPFCDVVFKEGQKPLLCRERIFG